MIFNAILVSATLFSDGGGGPDHPRLMFSGPDIEFLQENLSHPMYSESFQRLRDDADNAGSPAVDKDWHFGQIASLYPDLHSDATDAFSCALTFALTRNSSYKSKAMSLMRNIVNRVDVNYRSVSWYRSIHWDISCIKMLNAADLMWNDISDADRASLTTWFDTLADSVRVLHEAETNGGYYRENWTGNNIKSWDNALLGLTGYLLGDPERIDYVIRNADNKSKKDGRWIELNHAAQVRNSIVEEHSGPNSQYGPYRTVDWDRASGQEENEHIGYAVYHQYALDVLAKAALNHDLDLFHIATRAWQGDSRHHPYQPIERLIPFFRCEVDAEDNNWRTWSGGRWTYSDDDRFKGNFTMIQNSIFSDQVPAPGLQRMRSRLDEMIQGGLKPRVDQKYYDVHILEIAWPLLRINNVRGYPTVGDIEGQLDFEGGTGVNATVSLITNDPASQSNFAEYLQRETPVEVDEDGFFDAFHLPSGGYYVIARSDGFKSTVSATRIEEGESTDIGSLEMPEGAHSISPASMDYASRGTLERVSFKHYDPDGLPNLGGLGIWVEVNSRKWINLWALAPELFQIDVVDDKNLELSLDISEWSLPQDEVTFWYTLIGGGKISGDRARFRFRD